MRHLAPRPDGLTPAEPDPRLYAAALDRLIGWTLTALVGLVAFAALSTTLAVVVSVIVALAVWAAFAVLAGLTGTTPGKQAAGLRVVDAATGSPIGPGRGLLRALLLGVAGLPTLGIGAASLAWTALADRDGRRRGWHDHLTGSLVIDVSPSEIAVEELEAEPAGIVNLTALRLAPVEAREVVTVPATPGPVVPAPPSATQVRLSSQREESVRWEVSFDTGETFEVEGLTLVGRAPSAAPGEPVVRLVTLPSADQSLSKTHAQFLATPFGDLVVLDRGSTNGSLLTRGDATRVLDAESPVTLLDGDRVRFGDRTMQVRRKVT